VPGTPADRDASSKPDEHEFERSESKRGGRFHSTSARYARGAWTSRKRLPYRVAGRTSAESPEVTRGGSPANDNIGAGRKVGQLEHGLFAGAHGDGPQTVDD